MRKVFLTGGTGFIGQPLSKALLDRGWQVTALVRQTSSPAAQVVYQLGAALAPGDVTDRESMRSAMAGADIVIHNAGFYEFGLAARGRQKAQKINVDGTDNVLSLALELGIPRTVYVSTTWAYGESGPELRDETFVRNTGYRSFYEQSKSEAHELALSYQQRGLPLVIASPNGVAGPNDHGIWGYFIRLYVNNWMPPLTWSPDTLHSTVAVQDVAEGIALVAEKGRLGESYLLCGEPRTLREHLAIWNEKPGGSKQRIWLPTGLAAFSFWPLEPLLRLIGLPAFLSRESARVGGSNLNYSSAKARREFGWQCRGSRSMWHEIIDAERALLAERRGQGIVARLRPLPAPATIPSP